MLLLEMQEPGLGGEGYGRDLQQTRIACGGKRRKKKAMPAKV